jgi:hypothetical protein
VINAIPESLKEPKIVLILATSVYIAQQNREMISKTVLYKGTLSGIIAGILLGASLKIVEAVTGHQVYTLLLNVDFIPVIGRVSWPEYIEFIFHLLVSIILGIIFYYLAGKWRLKTYQSFYLAAALTVPALFLYFPLSLLAIKEVPEIGDWTAFSYWAAGHLVYLVSLTKMYSFSKKK